MRHRVKRKLFNRNTKARKALFKSLLSNLFEHGMIETTETKAKQVKRLADKLIYRAKPGTVQARRLLERFFGSKQVVNRLVDSVAPAMEDRNSGFTRITHLGRRRGDDAEMVMIELVSEPIERVEDEKVVVEKPAKAKKAEKKSEAKKPAAQKVAASEAPEAEEKKTTKKAASKPKTAAKKK